MAAPTSAIAAAIATATALGEKGCQVCPSEVTAFGIRLQSRYGKAAELAELLRFAENVATLGAAPFVRSAFYDSKACLCSFELCDGVDRNTDALAAIYRSAEKTIHQFQWVDGSIVSNFDSDSDLDDDNG